MEYRGLKIKVNRERKDECWLRVPKSGSGTSDERQEGRGALFVWF